MFQYRVTVFTSEMFSGADAIADQLSGVLNQYAKEGWRVVAVTSGSSAFFITLERESPAGSATGKP